jgi:hypothetical protein
MTATKKPKTSAPKEQAVQEVVTETPVKPPVHPTEQPVPTAEDIAKSINSAR